MANRASAAALSLYGCEGNREGLDDILNQRSGASGSSSSPSAAAAKLRALTRQQLIHVDHVCRLAFPVVFLIFNGCYVLYYSSPSREQIANEGFTLLD